jgi:hypothetical protein
MTKYSVKAYCCVAGNCATCNGMYNRANRKTTLVLAPTTDKAKAENARDKWRQYGAFIEEKTS